MTKPNSPCLDCSKRFKGFVDGEFKTCHSYLPSIKKPCPDYKLYELVKKQFNLTVKKNKKKEFLAGNRQ